MSRPRSNTGAHFISDIERITLEADGRLSAQNFLRLMAILKAIIERINGNITFSHSGTDGEWTGNIDGQLRIVNAPQVAATEFMIEHGLGRKPVQMLQSSDCPSALLYANPAQRASWDEERVYVASNVGSVSFPPAGVNFWVFFL